MNNNHAGSWTNPLTGQPITDRGWTEKITDALGFARTSAGGSDLVMDQYQNPNTANLDKSGGYQLNPADASRYGSSVLGVSASRDLPTTDQNKKKTSNNGGGGGGGGFDMKYYPGWGYAEALADWNATGGAKGRQSGGGGEEDFSQLISDQYAPALGALGEIETGLRSSNTKNLEDVNTSFGEGEQSVNRQQKELEDSLASQGVSLQKSGQSAYSEALRNLNGLFQTMASRFGSGSSTGGAAGEIIGQEFLRNQGKMRESLTQGEQALSQESTKVKSYIADKVTQLGQWKREAIRSIDENFQNKMSEIAMRRGDIEANKTRDRIALLQDSVQRARDIQTRDQEFKQGLAKFAVETLQSASSKTFTPKEIAGIVNEMMGQNIDSFNRNTAAPGIGINYNPTQKGKTLDELKGLNILGSANA